MYNKKIKIMKSIKLFLLAIMSTLVSNVALADDRPIPVEQLPAQAKQFVANNFKGSNIVYAEVDWDSYECRLDNGTKVKFDRRGTWKKVDCEGMTVVPAALVPAAILQYVKVNFAGCSVVKIDKEYYGYDVELSNEIDLKFSHQGELMGMDD